MNHESSRCREVTRPGIVTAVHGPVADIQIVQYSACSSCHIRALCTSSESAPKTVQTPNDGTLAPGMSVVLAMDERLGWLGVTVGFVLPLALVVVTLFLTKERVPREEIAGLIALATLLPYYGVVRAMRRFFDRVVRFRIVSRQVPVPTPVHGTAGTGIGGTVVTTEKATATGEATDNTIEATAAARGGKSTDTRPVRSFHLVEKEGST